MNEERINKIERDLAVMNNTQKSMSDSLERISQSLERISETHSEIKLINQRAETDSKRITRIEGIISKVTWLVVTPLIAGVIALYVKGK